MPEGNGLVPPGQGSLDSRRRDDRGGATTQVQGTTPIYQARPGIIGHVGRAGKSTDVKAKGRESSNLLATKAARVAGRVFRSLDELPDYAIRPLNVSRNRPRSHPLIPWRPVGAQSHPTEGRNHYYDPGERESLVPNEVLQGVSMERVGGNPATTAHHVVTRCEGFCTLDVGVPYFRPGRWLLLASSTRRGRTTFHRSNGERRGKRCEVSVGKGPCDTFP